jgi:hypothetical protein
MPKSRAPRNSQSYDGVDALGDTYGKDGKESLITGRERAGGLVALFAPLAHRWNDPLVTTSAAK